MRPPRALLLAAGSIAVACSGHQTPPAPGTPATPSNAQTESADVTRLRDALRDATTPAAQLVARGALGDALWTASCGSIDDGLCLTTRPPTAGHHCGTTSRPWIVAAPRGAEADEAREQLAQVQRLWNRGALLADVPAEPTTEADRDATARNRQLAAAYGAARLALADADAEAFFATTPPPDEHGLARWIQEATRQSDAARAGYEAIVDDELLARLDPSATIGAIAQIGRLYGHWADLLLEIDVPAKLLEGEYAHDAETAFCAALDEQTAPLEQRALDAWRACVERAAALGVTGAWPDRCRREHDLRRPGETL